MSRVVVYFFNGGWIPIAFYPLIDAINLYRKGLSSGMDIAVFPTELEPRSIDPLLTTANSPITPKQKDTEVVTDKSSQAAQPVASTSSTLNGVCS